MTRSIDLSGMNFVTTRGFNQSAVGLSLILVPYMLLLVDAR